MSDSEQRTVYLLVVAALRALERRLKHVLGAAHHHVASELLEIILAVHTWRRHE